MADGGGVDHTVELKALRREQRVQRDVLFGNGRPGLDSRVDTLDNIVLGDERTKEPGLKSRTKVLEDGRREDKWVLRVILAIVLAMSGGMDIKLAGSLLRGMLGF